LCVDALIMNRVLPRELAAGYLEAWTRVQAREIARAKEQFASVPMLSLRFQSDEVLGPRALALAGKEVYARHDPAMPFAQTPPLRFRREGGRTILELRLPHADAATLDLKQRDDELIVTVGGWRRQLPLPPSLRGHAVESAKFRGDSLSIHFSTEREKTP
jgi:arsenite-transporting ATPase